MPLPKYAIMRSIGRVRVLEQNTKDTFWVLDSRDQRRLVHRDQLIFVRR